MSEVLAKQLDMEGEREDKTDGEASNSSQKRHDAVEGRENDGNKDKNYSRENANRELEEAPVKTGGAVEGLCNSKGASVEAQEQLYGADDRTGAEMPLVEGASRHTAKRLTSKEL